MAITVKVYFALHKIRFWTSFTTHFTFYTGIISLFYVQFLYRFDLKIIHPFYGFRQISPTHTCYYNPLQLGTREFNQRSSRF